MADIVARLANMTRDGYRYYDHHDGDAVHCAIQDAGKEITTLRARIDKLEKALEPFAEKADIIARDHPGWNHDVFQWGAEPLVFTMKALRDARAALDQDKGGSDG